MLQPRYYLMGVPPDVEFTKYFKAEDITVVMSSFCWLKQEASGTYDLTNNQGLSRKYSCRWRIYYRPFEFNKDGFFKLLNPVMSIVFHKVAPPNVSELKPVNDEPEGAIILKDINDGGQPETTYHMEATPSSIPRSNISAANDDGFKFNAENVYRVTIYDAINEGEIFHADMCYIKI